MAKSKSDLLLVDDDTPPLPDPLPNIWVTPVPPAPTPCNNWVDLVVREGYINKATQIDNLRQAGQQLHDHRDFYYYDGVPSGDTLLPEEEEENITARHDFDFAEAESLRRFLDSKREKRKKAAAERQPQPVTPPPLWWRSFHSLTTASDRSHTPLR